MIAKLIFSGKKQKYFFFEKPNNQKPKTKKNVFFQLHQFSIFFRENFRDLRRINWCKGHWCGRPTSAQKRGKNKKISLFWAYVVQPDDHIGWATSMPFASIYSTEIFMKNIESWRCWKMKFCFLFFLFVVIGFFKKKLF